MNMLKKESLQIECVDSSDDDAEVQVHKKGEQG